MSDDTTDLADRRIDALYVRMRVPNPSGGFEREEEHDSTPFDATEAVLRLEPESIRSLQDRRDSTDALAPDAPGFSPLGGEHGGGTDVVVTDSICHFFEVTSITKVTDEMVEAARRAHGIAEPAPLGMGR